MCAPKTLYLKHTRFNQDDGQNHPGLHTLHHTAAEGSIWDKKKEKSRLSCHLCQVWVKFQVMNGNQSQVDSFISVSQVSLKSCDSSPPPLISSIQKMFWTLWDWNCKFWTIPDSVYKCSKSLTELRLNPQCRSSAKDSLFWHKKAQKETKADRWGHRGVEQVAGDDKDGWGRAEGRQMAWL